ncbi:DUF3784 domain-containing protein [Bacillus sp. COPE52]|uniref:DUF3784 domain-containing protein n=1 Tax=Bacillus sp. COPE52 TaxID=2233998 RepID=UPI000E104FA2|nr:DUF3784 domain-containing protein [Bacillus sp. COPE52]AXK19374.1 DUF3784 domain-containing protein [Bacillus sp. COPE52]
MTLFAYPSLFILAIISFALAYFIGVKQYTWLLSGFNERRVLDKVKLSKIVGLYNLFAGVIATIGSVFTTPNVKIIVPIILIGHFIIAIHVNTRMIH